MNRVVLLIVLVFGVVSCGTTRHLVSGQESGAFAASALADTSALTLRIDELVGRRMSESVGRLLSQEVTITRELLSDPDSAGRQHVVERTVASFSTKISEDETRMTADTTAKTARKDSTTVSAAVSVSASVTDMHNEEHAEPQVSGLGDALRWIVVGIFLAAVAAVLIKVFRR